jgi:hypothetical protein
MPTEVVKKSNKTYGGKPVKEKETAGKAMGGSVYMKATGTRPIVQLTISSALQREHGFDTREHVLFKFDEKNKVLYVKFRDEGSENTYKVFRSRGTFQHNITALLRKFGLTLSEKLMADEFPVVNGEVVIDLSGNVGPYDSIIPERKKKGKFWLPYTERDRVKVETIVRKHVKEVNDAA